MKNKKQKKYQKINIALSPDIMKKLDKGNYNKNKLIISLLKKYFEKK